MNGSQQRLRLKFGVGNLMTDLGRGMRKLHTGHSDQKIINEKLSAIDMLDVEALM